MSDELKKLLLEHYTPEEAFEWLFAPHPAFAGRSAMDWILQGDARATLNWVDVIMHLRNMGGPFAS
jgi:hypothetical protein